MTTLCDAVARNAGFLNVHIQVRQILSLGKSDVRFCRAQFVDLLLDSGKVAQRNVNSFANRDSLSRLIG